RQKKQAKVQLAAGTDNKDSAGAVAPRGIETDSLPVSCQGSGKVSEAVGRQIELLRRQPSSQGYRSLGDMYLEESNVGCAVAAFKTALKLKPTDSETRVQLGLVLLQAGHAEQAADELRLSLKQTPDSFLGHNALGLVLEELGALEGAREEFKTAVD